MHYVTGIYTFLVAVPVIILALAITVYYINRRSLSNRLFALFLFAAFGWMFTGYMFYIDASLLHRLLPIQMAIGSFSGTLFYLFTRAFVDESYRIKRWESIFFLPCAAIAVTCALIEISPALFAEFGKTAAIVDGAMIRKPSPLYTAYTATICVGVAAGFVVLARGYRRETDAGARRRIAITIGSLVFGVVGVLVVTNILTLLGMAGYDRISLVMILLGLLGISFTIIRHRAWTIEHIVDLLEVRSREIEGDLETARLLQRKLLPGAVLDAPGCRFAATYIPMDKVGGDFYDHSSADGSIRLFIADVSGHGLPGAFLATVTKVALDGITERPAASGVLLKLNDSICRATVNNNYVTAFYCMIDRAMRSVRYCSAGHLPQFLFRRRTGECIPMKTPGMPLGWFGGIRLVEGSMDLEPGDRLVLYTDGIVECASPRGEMFGEERLISFIAGHEKDSPQAFLDGLIAEISAFAGSATFHDDITCLVLDLPAGE